MKRLRALGVALGLAWAGSPAGASEQFFDRLEDTLTFSARDAWFRGRLSGLLDLEAYALQLPAPGVIFARGETLFTPRLNLFLDAQLGHRLYVFAQARVDRGFDPAPERLRPRLDEYALRYSPRPGAMVQVGKFATIVGNWAVRHASWANPFITAPVPYEYLTGVWDTEAVRTSNVLLQWSHVRGAPPGPDEAAREKSLRLPIVWGPSYASGVAAALDIGALRLAAEVKSGSLSSRPEAWDHSREQRHHPTVAVRAGYRPNPMWDLGVSASGGAYLREFAGPLLPPGRHRGDYRQLVLAHDLAFAWRHWQVWGEVFAARFEIPVVGDAETVAYYVETKYKFTPQFFGAVRWNEQLFGRIADRGRRTEWGHQIWRLDLAPGYRFTPHTQLKLQYSLQRGDAPRREHSRTLAAQFSLRF